MRTHSSRFRLAVLFALAAAVPVVACDGNTHANPPPPTGGQDAAPAPTDTAPMPTDSATPTGTGAGTDAGA